MAANLLGLDFGTSALHCMVADPQGRCLADCHAPIRYFTPEGESELTREFDPQEVLDTAARLTVRALAQANVAPSDVAAVGITSQRHGLVFLDDDDREILVSPNVDLRAAFEGAALQEEMGPALYQATGQFPAMLLAPAKLRWLENNRPALRKRVARILTVAGWLAVKLTGSPACEPSLAAGVGLLDPRSVNRDGTMLSKIGVPPSLLPPMFRGRDRCREAAARCGPRWGLAPGTPVTLAGADTSCGLVGMGLTRPGDTGLVAGWSASMQTITDSPRPDPQAKAWFSPFPIPGRWVSEVNLGDAGNAHRWLKDLLLGPDATFAQADALTASAPVGSNGYLSYLGPAPITAPEAGLRRGGLLFPIPLLYRSPTSAEALRAFWESLAYSVKANLSDLERVSGQESPVLHLGGGVARSPLFAGILASVLGRRVRRSATAHVSLMGAVAAASVAAGFHPNLAEASEAMAPQWVDVEPDPSDALEYEEFYQQWKILYHKIQDV